MINNPAPLVYGTPAGTTRVFNNTHETAKTILTDNYIYISHLDEEVCGVNPTPQFWKLPCYPEIISDNMPSNFQATNALGRSAPVYTYQNSGPRTVQISIALHRDIMDEANTSVSNVPLVDGEDYTEALIKALQAIALPKYNLENKLIEPPVVAVRLANEVFIKGVVASGVGLEYELPILDNGRYACIKISFTVSEADPYDSSAVFKNGTFRGMMNTFRNSSSLTGGTLMATERMGEW